MNLYYKILFILLICLQTITPAQDNQGAPRDIRIKANEELPPDIINVADPNILQTYSLSRSMKLGYLNIMPIEESSEADSFSPDRKIFLFRNKQPFILGPDQSVSFILRIGDIHEIYFWPESLNSQAEYDIQIIKNNGFGRNDILVHDSLISWQFGYASINCNSEIEIIITKTTKSSDRDQVWLTVSPQLLLPESENSVLPGVSSIIP